MVWIQFPVLLTLLNLRNQKIVHLLTSENKAYDGQNKWFFKRASIFDFIKRNKPILSGNYALFGEWYAFTPWWCIIVIFESRVRFYTQEIVFFRQDLLYRMRRSCLIPPSTEETSDPFEHVIFFLLLYICYFFQLFVY